MVLEDCLLFYIAVKDLRIFKGNIGHFKPVSIRIGHISFKIRFINIIYLQRMNLHPFFFFFISLIPSITHVINSRNLNTYLMVSKLLGVFLYDIKKIHLLKALLLVMCFIFKFFSFHSNPYFQILAEINFLCIIYFIKIHIGIIVIHLRWILSHLILRKPLNHAFIHPDVKRSICFTNIGLNQVGFEHEWEQLIFSC